MRKYNKKESVYLDTTIPSAYFDKREPEKMKIAQKLWEFLFARYDIYISDVTVSEIMATPGLTRRKQIMGLLQNSIFCHPRESGDPEHFDIIKVMDSRFHGNDAFYSFRNRPMWRLLL